MAEKRSVGGALRRALGIDTIKFDVEPRLSGTSLLMNPRRLRIFEYLWSNPCSHVRQVSRATEIPVESLKWHLRMLERSGFLGSKRFERRVVYYPKELIRTKDIILFAQLSDSKRKGLLNILAKMPDGIELEELSSITKISKQALHYHISILEKISIVTHLSDKRPFRFKLDKTVEQLEVYYAKSTKKVIRWLMLLFENDCLSPTLVQKDKHKAIIRISLRTTKRTLELNLNPMNSLFGKN